MIPFFHKPIDSFVHNWINNTAHNFLIIVGEYGTGKTTYCRYLTHQLADHYLNKKESGGHHNITQKPIPLFCPLRDYEKSMEGFLAKQLERKALKTLSSEHFRQKLNEGEIVLILDGFDEMTQDIDSRRKKTNFLNIQSLLNKNSKAKIILTVRAEYFFSSEERWEVFGINSENELPTVHLHSFNDEQIQQFLQSRDDNPHKRWNQIQEIQGLKDIASRPVLLQIIIDHLEALLSKKSLNGKIKASDLYEEAINSEINRKETEILLKIHSEDRIEILEKLSAWMFVHDTLFFEVPLLEDELQLKAYFNVQRDWEYQRYLNDFLTFSFQLNEGYERFRISHKSFRDYLASRHFLKEIETGKFTYFPKAKLTEEIITFLLEQNPKQSKLFELVINSKSLNEETRWLGSNAANILLRLNPHAFAGKDLSNTDLPGVNFIFADLRGTKLQNANLENSTLNRGVLEASLEETNLLGCSFYPFFMEAKNFEEANQWMTNTKIRKIYSHITSLHPLENTCGLTLLDLRGSSISDISYIASLNNLTSLSLQGNSISDISYIASLNNLTSLSLQGNSISDISYIASLNNLTSLTLQGHSISDISSIASLNNLTSLTLLGNSISDISSIASLNNLTSLTLLGNSISDISSIASLNNLTSLTLQGHSISDISSIASLNNLTSLGLHGNSISDISSIASLNNLTSLSLHRNSISDISYIASLNNLTSLTLQGHSISDISSIASLNNLTSLSLQGNSVSDISYIASLNNLTSLNLHGNSISDISSIASLNNLTSLSLQGNSVSDISYIASLNNLTSLNLHGNSISDISSIASLNNLTSLTLQGHSISDISSIASLNNLTSLTLHGNSISDISSIASLNNLTSLTLQGHSISDISSIASLNNLTSLTLHGNSISDISSIASLNNLTSLTLQGHSISDISSIASLNNLTSLTLHGNSISDISSIASLNNLTSLNLHGHSISDISSIASLNNLTSLTLHGNSISDIKSLFKLKYLSILRLKKNHFDKDQIKKLTDELPFLLIKFYRKG